MSLVHPLILHDNYECNCNIILQACATHTAASMQGRPAIVTMLKFSKQGADAQWSPVLVSNLKIHRASRRKCLASFHHACFQVVLLPKPSGFYQTEVKLTGKDVCYLHTNQNSYWICVWAKFTLTIINEYSVQCLHLNETCSCDVSLRMLLRINLRQSKEIMARCITWSVSKMKTLT